jgi:hypothetical protein
MAARKWREIGGKKVHISDVLFNSFAAAMEDDWLAGSDPFLDLSRKHGNEVGDGGGEDIKVGG